MDAQLTVHFIRTKGVYEKIISRSGLSEKLIYLNNGICHMRKLLVTIRALFNGQASIEYVEKTRVSKTPGDVTDLAHN